MAILEPKGGAAGAAAEGARLSGAFDSEIQVVGRCAQILRLLTSGTRSLRAAEVAEELQLGRSTAHRYLSSLCSAGFLERVEEGGYRVGPLLVQLGTIALGGLRVLEVADPRLRRLAEETHETAVLAVWGGLGPVVARVHEDSDRLVHVSVRVGSTLPLPAAQAQVFLAFMADRRLASRLLDSLAPREREEIELSIASVKKAGVCISSRVVEGIRSVATPVFDDRGDVCATVALVGTASTIPADTSTGMVAALVESAAALSRQLGYMSSLPFESELGTAYENAS